MRRSIHDRIDIRLGPVESPLKNKRFPRGRTRPNDVSDIGRAGPLKDT